MVKILIIEDDVNVRENLVEMLQFEGYNVLSAENGIQGVHLTFEQHPDIVFSDISMSGIDGYEVLKIIRQNPMTFNIPFVFLTAKTDRDDQRTGMELGADDYLTKPFQKKDIINAINIRLEKQSKINDASIEKLEQLRNSLILSLPHELTTPLNSILGFTQLLKSEWHSFSENEIQIMLSSVENASNRLYRLIVNFLFYAKLLEDIDKTEFQQNQITSSTITIISHEIHRISALYNSNSKVISKLEDSKLIIKEDYFIKVIDELIDNAFKFSNNNTNITINSYVKNNRYYFSISNYGVGMTDEQIAKIGAFMQFDRDKFEQQGSGMGLAIVKKIIESLGTDFIIHSDYGCDITIIVSFKIIQ